MQITATQARQTDGSTVVNLVNTPGRLTVIGEEPLLELVIYTNGHPTLVLYGKPAWNCDVNESPRLDAAPPRGNSTAKPRSTTSTRPST